MKLLEARDIRKHYGALQVLRGVTLAVAPGETFAIIGPNGAGKTTLFKVLTGETLDFSGCVELDGVDVSASPAFRRARAGMGRTFQVARIFGELPVITNVVAAVEARKAAVGERDGPWWDWRPSPATLDEASAILADVGLETGRDVEASLLSHGDKKRLELAVTLAGRPRILMLDEPTAGMSVADRRGIAAMLRRLKERGVTLVMTEHDMDIIFDLADRLMVLNYGEVVSTGDPVTVRQDPLVRQVYLGKGEGHA